VIVLAVLVWRRDLRLPVPPRAELAPAAAAAAVLAMLGSLLNDSGIFVAAAVLLAFLPAALAASPGKTARPRETAGRGDTGRS